MTSRPTHTVIDSPVGPLTLVAAEGALCGLYMEGQRHLPAAETFGQREDTVLTDAVGQVEEYFAGQRTQFDVPMAFAGTRFQQLVWNALLTIRYGQTVSYGLIARQIGKPAASRAVGLANGRNPISIIVPCHRVVGSAGQLTGYGGGLERKRFLLDLERGGAPTEGVERALRASASPIRGGAGEDVENDHQMPGLVDLVEDAPLTAQAGGVDASQGLA